MLLPVTSIRKLAGTPYGLVEWQLGNIIDAMLGTQKRPAIGKRGKPLKGRSVRSVFEFPSEAVTKYIATEGLQGRVDEFRKWLRATADEPRNVAARRGTMVHMAIERSVQWSRIERPWVEAAFMGLSARDRAAAKNGVTDDDVRFVRNAVRQYEDMRKAVPFVIIAREPQVFNLTLGYGGSADVLIWFLPDGLTEKDVPKPHLITIDDIRRIGGWLAVGDWKTSKDVYTDQIVQVHLYGAGEFVGSDGVVDHRLTAILQATTRGVLLHVRPNKWGAHTFEFSQPVFRAAVGSVAFARFLAENPKPFNLFIDDRQGGLPELSEEFE